MFLFMRVQIVHDRSIVHINCTKNDNNGLTSPLCGRFFFTDLVTVLVGARKAMNAHESMKEGRPRNFLFHVV